MNLLQNFRLAVIEYLYRERRAIPLQTFTTRHTYFEERVRYRRKKVHVRYLISWWVLV